MEDDRILAAAPLSKHGGSHEPNNLIEINSPIDFPMALLGRVAMVLFTLRREPREINADGKRRTHCLLKRSFEGILHAVQRIRDSAGHLVVPSLALQTGLS
ncbi:MAG: hypothetical protein HY574_09325 [candidate division NC10 bacterium]|nr:hypothetical protein [candidate division NC10 bacterium]